MILSPKNIEIQSKSNSYLPAKFPANLGKQPHVFAQFDCTNPLLLQNFFHDLQNRLNVDLSAQPVAEIQSNLLKLNFLLLKYNYSLHLKLDHIYKEGENYLVWV